MIRFIIRRRVTDLHSNSDAEIFFTIDASVPELEAALRRGGLGENGSDVSSLIACELLEEIEGE